MHRDDALAEHLSHAERSQIKRRIANRESARRVRKRKQHDTDDLSRQVRPVAPIKHELAHLFHTLGWVLL